MIERALPPGPCAVDGCAETLDISWNDARPLEKRWRVQHGGNPEAAMETSSDLLLVSPGYREWARAVHRYEMAKTVGAW